MRFLGTALGLAAFLWASPSAARDFSVWLEAVRQEARAAGISEKVVREALPDTLAPNERIIRLDRKQPEGGVSFEKYKANVVTPSRIKAGRGKMAQHRRLLQEVGNAYGVEPQYIAALWGIETSFGRNMGGFEIIPALVTLAYEGRREDFFRRELLKALRIVDEGHIGLREMKGSWAGAMGQCQFMPTSFEKYARDHDGDGRRDIWGTEADVFASTAAYLSGMGWKKGQPWGVLVRLPPGFDEKMIGIKVQKSLQSWEDMGISLSARPFGPGEMISIVQPGGKGYKAYAVGGNYRILMDWNTSTYFATAVGFLADRLKI